MIIRIQSHIGMNRIDVEPTTTISQIKHKIAEILKCLATQIELCLKRNETSQQDLNLLNDSITVQQIPLQNGDILLVKNSSIFQGEEVKKENEIKEQIIVDPNAIIRLPQPKCRYHGPKASCIRCLQFQMTRVKRQEKAKSAGSSFAKIATQKFIEYAANTLGFSTVRNGYLFGKLVDNSLRIEIIYETADQNDENQLEIAIRTSSYLGYSLVGMITTHIDNENIPNCFELMHLAKLQIAQNFQESNHELIIAIITNVNGDFGVDVFQLSEQLIDLTKRNFFVNVDNATNFKIKEKIFVGTKETDTIEREFFFLPLGIQSHDDELSCNFPIENRIEYDPRNYLKKLISDKKNLSKNLLDFHALFFVFNFFGQTEFEVVVDNLKRGQNISQGFETLLLAFVNQF
eukprot:TRINITY_DN516_c1_g3_i1.p1 TRINITY_DN516_c1_g3~~TRINITY_DN516_c1_g3_i1.p1  ORF type:complete len:403 (+),score=159.73 TRINITY_DN516_c1_g3_i1:142-1350(+)